MADQFYWDHQMSPLVCKVDQITRVNESALVDRGIQIEKKAALRQPAISLYLSWHATHQLATRGEQ